MFCLLGHFTHLTSPQVLQRKMVPQSFPQFAHFMMLAVLVLILGSFT